jgi:inward rectifier potassium channel
VSDKPIKVTFPAASYEIHILGAQRTPLRDFYHLVLRISWPATFGLLALVYLAVNALFALGFWSFGGLAGPHRGTYLEAFYFSVQTMGTIGYGAITPTTTASNLLVVAESITGLILTALATGIVFAKFSRPTARVVFTKDAVIAPMNGVPTLSFRLGNQRSNQIVDAQIRVILTRTEKTTEGKTFYRILDLPLTRDRALSLSRSLSVMHTIDERSPLYGMTGEALAEQDVELAAMVVGLDDTTMQPVHAYHRWFADHIQFGVRHVDIISEPTPDRMIVDLRRFDDLEPA